MAFIAINTWVAGLPLNVSMLLKTSSARTGPSMPSFESEVPGAGEAGEGAAGAAGFCSAVCQLQRETERHSASAIIPRVFICSLPLIVPASPMTANKYRGQTTCRDYQSNEEWDEQ